MPPRGSSLSTIAWLMPLSISGILPHSRECSNMLRLVCDTESVLEPQGHSWEHCPLLETDNLPLSPGPSVLSEFHWQSQLYFSEIVVNIVV